MLGSKPPLMSYSLCTWAEERCFIYFKLHLSILRILTIILTPWDTEEILGEVQLLSPCTVSSCLPWTRATCCYTQEAVESWQAPHPKHQLTATRRAFRLSLLPSVPWLPVQLAELGRVKRQHALRSDLHTSEPQPEQTPQQPQKPL